MKGNEGHGFANEENRLYFYRAVERFLARHLGGRAEESAEKIPELEGAGAAPAVPASGS